MPIDAFADDEKKKAAQPTVSSVGQKNGVTAGYVNQLNQILPTLVRGPQLEKLKSIFTDGARIKREFLNVRTDADIENVCTRADSWVNATYSWLGANVSDYAAERFAFRPAGLAMSYSMPGDHASGYVNRWGSTHAMLSEYLTNLDQLMRDPSIYPPND